MPVQYTHNKSRPSWDETYEGVWVDTPRTTLYTYNDEPLIYVLPDACIIYKHPSMAAKNRLISIFKHEEIAGYTIRFAYGEVYIHGINGMIYRFNEFNQIYLPLTKSCPVCRKVKPRTWTPIQQPR